MGTLVPPHGGELKPRLLTGKELAAARLRVASLPQVKMTSKEVSDLIMLAMGAFSPLEGFIGRADYRGVINKMKLTNGVLWPIPVTLAIDSEAAGSIDDGSDVALVAEDTGEILGIMTVEEKYSYDKTKEAQKVFTTTEEQHPGVKRIYDQGGTYLGGPVQVISEGGYAEKYPEYARPAETRKLFEEKGWRTVAAFQTRNPIHRSHEYLTKVALEVCDGVLIHPVVGKLKDGDIPAAVRMKCYQVMLDNYYKPRNTVLKVYPMEMRYGGPREAILHAIIRQNFGCSHMIIGRDHAGVGDYYGPFDAQDIFDNLATDDLHLQPLKLDWTFWCHKCEAIVSTRTCPHGKDDHLMISGTNLRSMLARGERPPREFCRPEVIDILIDYYAQNGQ
ncbi:MAG: sulfate adenylyltransferase [Candidatus Marinimicrobia bacterium]|nr:sulfate adenylyltransferase [Candidatus Neomarinimicrobiota bacterium]